MKNFKEYKPVTPGRRNRLDRVSQTVALAKPVKKLLTIKKKRGGRNSQGRVTVRHRGGGHKRFLRQIDFKRDKRDIKAKVISLEYDPNRSANIALLVYQNGEKRYILAPKGLKIGAQVEAGEKADFKPGNALPLKKIPLGMPIHNLELTFGKGGQIVRGAGTAAIIQSREKGMATVKLPSGEMREIDCRCYATLGQLGNIHMKDVKLGKAGRKRWRGIRPSVRGVAMHPGAHPHGGGEGRSGIGMPSPKTPWGKKTLGKKTRKKKKYSDKYIIKRRRK
jgi:large subunit ribosomal protein L2